MTLAEVQENAVRSNQRTRRRPEEALSQREVELSGIIDAYNRVTERLKESHDALTVEVRRLQTQLDEKDRELELKRRLAALGEMAAGVAHEVRNPLGGIVLYADMLLKDLADEPEAVRKVRQIRGAAGKLDEIVRDVLAFAGEGAPRFSRVSLERVVSEVLELLELRCARPGGGVQVEVEGPAPVIHADSVQVQRVLLNVVGNALDASGERGTVRVNIRIPTDEPEWVVVRVEDDGPGLPGPVRERMFDPFFTTKDSGTGLGLAIVHRVMESHGGRVVVSDGEPVGAVFELWFPRDWEDQPR